MNSNRDNDDNDDNVNADDALDVDGDDKVNFGILDQWKWQFPVGRLLRVLILSDLITLQPRFDLFKLRLWRRIVHWKNLSSMVEVPRQGTLWKLYSYRNVQGDLRLFSCESHNSYWFYNFYWPGIKLYFALVINKLTIMKVKALWALPLPHNFQIASIENAASQVRYVESYTGNVYVFLTFKTSVNDSVMYLLFSICTLLRYSLPLTCFDKSQRAKEKYRLGRGLHSNNFDQVSGFWSLLCELFFAEVKGTSHWNFL